MRVKKILNCPFEFHWVGDVGNFTSFWDVLDFSKNELTSEHGKILIFHFDKSFDQFFVLVFAGDSFNCPKSIQIFLNSKIWHVRWFIGFTLRVFSAWRSDFASKFFFRSFAQLSANSHLSWALSNKNFLRAVSWSNWRINSLYSMLYWAKSFWFLSCKVAIFCSASSLWSNAWVLCSINSS